MEPAATKSSIETNQFQKYIHVSKYSRWLWEEERRETWTETVFRYMKHMDLHLKKNRGFSMSNKLYKELSDAIYNGDVMPSMRALMTAGPALERSGIAAYNCSYLPIDHTRAFDETLYILSHGSGVGFSVEKKYVNQLPTIPSVIKDMDIVIRVKDSKEGWAESYRELIDLLYEGFVPDWNTDDVRPAGSPLKTFGGYASGPGPLEDLFKFTIDVFNKARGRKLTPLEVFDIVCMIGRVIVSGGVRRSALICLTDLDDTEMASAKSGTWREVNPQRGMANISAVYEEKPSEEVFVREWDNLIANRSGERGIFNRESAIAQAIDIGREPADFGTNPCGEIFLRPKSFCNLTEVVVREDDDEFSLSNKVMLATILGTFQTTIDNFPYLRQEWTDNVQEERLLGVSLTGVFGNKIFSDLGSVRSEEILEDLRDLARTVNEFYAQMLDINKSAAITCVKPSGTVSLLNGVSAGIHPWYAKYYWRTVRGNNVEPMTMFLQDQGVPNEPDVSNPDNVTVFYFTMRAPDGAILRKDLSALDHLEHWKKFKKNWCEHNPSITVQVKEEEWADVANWVYKNFDEVGGLTFLPYDSGSYVQAPFQEIDEETYKRISYQIPNINWEALRFYEKYDSMENSNELACSSGACEVVDLKTEEADRFLVEKK